MARRLSLPVIGLLLAGAALGACRDEAGKGEYFAISGKLFEFNYRLAKATYIVTLNPLQPMDGSQVAVATFENPAGGEPLVIRQKIWPRLSHVTLESPPLTCVVKDKPYAVSINIEAADGSVRADARHHDHLVARSVDPAGPAAGRRSGLRAQQGSGGSSGRAPARPAEVRLPRARCDGNKAGTELECNRSSRISVASISMA